MQGIISVVNRVTIETNVTCVVELDELYYCFELLLHYRPFRYIIHLLVYNAVYSVHIIVHQSA